jgi:hypothetical protein
MDSVQTITMVYSHLTFSQTVSFSVTYTSGYPTLLSLASTDIFVPTGTTTLSSISTSIPYTYTVDGSVLLATT